MPCPLSVSLSKSGPFPRPALPGVFSRTDLSATRPARPAPHGGPVGACTPPIGLPVLLRLPSSMHAGTPTPAETVRCICRFSSRSVVGLPLISGGSAPALPVSRPARCSHHIPVAVGKRVTPLPPLRSPHARWGTGLLPRVFDGKTHRRPRVPNLDGWPMQCGNAHDIGDRGPVLL